MPWVLPERAHCTRIWDALDAVEVGGPRTGQQSQLQDLREYPETRPMLGYDIADAQRPRVRLYGLAMTRHTKISIGRDYGDLNSLGGQRSLFYPPCYVYS